MSDHFLDLQKICTFYVCFLWLIVTHYWHIIVGLLIIINIWNDASVSCCCQLFFCSPGEQNFENVLWHYIAITVCNNVILYNCIILTPATLRFCYYYWAYTMETKGTDIHHVNLFACHCILLYFVLQCGSFYIIHHTSSQRLDILEVGGSNCSTYGLAWVVVCTLVFWYILFYFWYCFILPYCIKIFGFF